MANEVMTLIDLLNKKEITPDQLTEKARAAIAQYMVETGQMRASELAPQIRASIPKPTTEVTEPEKPGFLERLKSHLPQFGAGTQALPGTGLGVSGTGHVVRTAGQPNLVERLSTQAGAGLAKPLTLGLVKPDVPEPQTAAERWARTGGELLGYTVPYGVAEATVGRLAAGAVSKALPAASSILRGALTAGASGMAAGAVVPTIEGAIQGKPAGEIAKEAAINAAFGGVLGAGGGAAGAALQRAAVLRAARKAAAKAPKALPAGTTPLQITAPTEVTPPALTGPQGQWTPTGEPIPGPTTFPKKVIPMTPQAGAGYEMRLSEGAFAGEDYAVFDAIRKRVKQVFTGKQSFWKAVRRDVESTIGKDAFSASQKRLDPLLREVPSTKAPKMKRYWLEGGELPKPETAAGAVTRMEQRGKALTRGILPAAEPPPPALPAMGEAPKQLPAPPQVRFEAGLEGTRIVGPGLPIYKGVASAEERLAQALSKRRNVVYRSRNAFWESVLKEAGVARDDPLVAQWDQRLREFKTKHGRRYIPDVLAPIPATKTQPGAKMVPAAAAPKVETVPTAPVAAPVAQAPAIAPTVPSAPVAPKVEPAAVAPRAKRVKAVKAARVAEAPVVPEVTPEVPAKPTMIRPKIGDTVYMEGKAEPLTVVDANDPALLTLRNKRGAEFKAGRRTLSMEPTAAEAPALQEPVPAAKTAVATETKPTGKTPDELTKQFQAEVAPALEKEAQRGSLRLGAEPYKPASPEVEKAFRAGEKPPAPVRETTVKMLKWLRTLKETFWDVEPLLKDHPSLVEALRVAKAIPQRAREKAIQMLEAIAGDITDPRQAKIFARLVTEENWLYSLQRGEAIPMRLTAKQLEAELANLRAHAAPETLRAVERHFELFRAIGEDLAVTRGKFPADSIRDKYLHHRVIRWAEDLDPRMPGLPRELKTPSRGYTKKRGGSIKPVATDYFQETYRHLTKIHTDNMLDDFIEEVARKADATADFMKMQEQRAKVFAHQGKTLKKVSITPGMRVRIGEKSYVGWTPNRGRAIYTPGTPTEENVLKIVESLAPRKGQQVFLLEENIAKRFNEFRTPDPAWLTALMSPTNVFHRLWKTVVINASGLLYHANNLVFGDFLNMTRNDPATWTELVPAIKSLLRGDKYLEGAKKAAVFDAAFFRAGGGVYTSPLIRKLAGVKGQTAYWNPFAVLRRAAAFREALPRVMTWIKNVKRIEAGQKVVARMVDIKGLTPMEATGRLARMVTIDYGQQPKGQAFLKELAFPFITWQIGNLKNHMFYAVTHPAHFAATVAIPYVAMQAYNNMRFPEIESSLPDWYRMMPHIVTGYYTEDDKAILLAYQTPESCAISWFGGTNILDEIWKAVRGEKDAKQAAVDAVASIPKGPRKELSMLLSPIWKTGIALLANKDSFTNREIVPERLKGTPEGKSLQYQYILESLFTPYGTIAQAAATRESGEAITDWLFKRPLSVKRALGYREVNVEAEEQRRFYEAKEKGQAAVNSAMEKVEKAYIAGMASGDLADYKAAIKEYGSLLTSSQVRSRLKSTRVQKQIVIAKLKKTKDEAERKRLETLLERLKEITAAEALKTAPRSQKAGLVESFRAMTEDEEE